MSAEQTLKAVRGSFIDFTRVVENPVGIAPALRFIEDGLLLIRHGKIESLSAYEAFYLATLGGARALGLDDLIGNFTPGKEADFVVLDPTSTPLQQLRYDNSVTLFDKLFVMMTLGDDRAIYRTYVDGRVAYERA